MDRALELATDSHAPRGENPRVGCVIVNTAGRAVGEGFHRGAGTPHAEVDALASAGDLAQGGTAVVTLEPCRHTGRTGPCTQALIDAGIRRVVFAQPDPNALASGGADALRAAGVEVIEGVRRQQAETINHEWAIAVARGYPFVTAKIAVSLDGRVAGAGGRRVQLTGPQARRFAHELRSRCQAVITGTGTVIADDPVLTVRDAPVPVSGQPLRVIMGLADVPAAAAIVNDDAPSIHVRERDPASVLRQLYAQGVRHVLLEAGPNLLRSFWQAECIDEVEWLLAGVWLGAGPKVFPDGEPLVQWATIESTECLGQDVRVRVRPASPVTSVDVDVSEEA